MANRAALFLLVFFLTASSAAYLYYMIDHKLMDVNTAGLILAGITLLVLAAAQINNFYIYFLHAVNTPGAWQLLTVHYLSVRDHTVSAGRLLEANYNLFKLNVLLRRFAQAEKFHDPLGETMIVKTRLFEYRILNAMYYYGIADFKKLSDALGRIQPETVRQQNTLSGRKKLFIHENFYQLSALNLIHEKKLTEAYHSVNKGIEQKNTALLQYTLGVVNYHRRILEDAVQELERALSMSGKKNIFIVIPACYYLFLIYCEMGRYRIGKDNFDRMKNASSL